MRKFVCILVLWGALAMGCSVIPKSVEQKALPAMPLPMLIQQAGQYIGQTVILGGYVLEVRNLNGNTRIVAMNAPLDTDWEPKSKELSDGHMILNYNGSLDPAVYASNRKITVAGVLQGSSETKTFQLYYPYVELLVTHIHLWSDKR